MLSLQPRHSQLQHGIFLGTRGLLDDAIGESLQAMKPSMIVISEIKVSILIIWVYVGCSWGFSGVFLQSSAMIEQVKQTYLFLIQKCWNCCSKLSSWALQACCPIYKNIYDPIKGLVKFHVQISSNSPKFYRPQRSASQRWLTHNLQQLPR